MLSKKKSISELLQSWQYDEELKQNIIHWHTLDGKQAEYAPFPDELHPSLQKALKLRGIEQLYTHQREAFDKATSKKRFIQSVQSTKYTLTTLKRYVEEGQSHAE